MTYTADINGDMITQALTRACTNYISAARTVASEGRPGEIITVCGPKGARRFKINAWGHVDRA